MGMNDEKADDVKDLNRDSRSETESSSEPLKPWMKTLGKEFYGNKELASYESLQDAVKALLSRPNKEVPSEYGKGDVDELFRKACASREDADAIDKYYRSMMPERKDRKDVFGDGYEDEESRYAKAVMLFGSDMKESIEKNGLDKDPTFSRIMARVGKELGQSSFRPGTEKRAEQSRNYFMEIVSNKMKG